MRIFAIILIFSIFVNILDGRSKAQAAQAQGVEDFRQFRSEHFIINYEKGVDKAYIFKIKKTAERFYRIITQEFNLIRDKLWIWEDRAKIFIAKDKESYLNIAECSSWSGACVNYQKKLIYTYPDQERFSSILIHELTHIIFREYVGGNDFPLWMDEGVAVYIEDKYGEKYYSSNLFSLKRKIKNNKYIDLATLHKITPEKLSNKSKNEAEFFYLESFSIVNFIVKKYKRYNFSRFLSYLRKGHSLEEALSKAFYNLRSLKNLEEQWKKFYAG